MTLKIGTDCSGIDAPVQALLQLNIPFEHTWACDIDKYSIQTILTLSNPKLN